MSEQFSHAANSHAYLNLKSIKCPVSILKLKSAVKKLHHGQRLMVIAGTSRQLNEIKSFCKLSDLRMLMEEKKENYYCLLICASC